MDVPIDFEENADKKKPQELAVQYGVSRRTIFNWKKKTKPKISSIQENSRRVTSESISGGFRAHYVTMRLNVLDKPNNWEARAMSVSQANPITKHRMGSWEDATFDVQGMTVRTTSDNIFLNCPEVWATTPQLAFAKLTEILHNAIPKIERYFGVTVHKSQWAIEAHIRKQHVEILKYGAEAVAQAFIGSNNKLEVYDDEGELRLICDRSGGRFNLEAVHPIRGAEDAQIVSDFLRQLVRDKPAADPQIDYLRDWLVRVDRALAVLLPHEVYVPQPDFELHQFTLDMIRERESQKQSNGSSLLKKKVLS